MIKNYKKLNFSSQNVRSKERLKKKKKKRFKKYYSC